MKESEEIRRKAVPKADCCLAGILYGRLMKENISLFWNWRQCPRRNSGRGKKAAAGQKGPGVVIDMRRSTMWVDNNIYKIPAGGWENWSADLLHAAILLSLAAWMLRFFSFAADFRNCLTSQRRTRQWSTPGCLFPAERIFRCTPFSAQYLQRLSS